MKCESSWGRYAREKQGLFSVVVSSSLNFGQFSSTLNKDTPLLYHGTKELSWLVSIATGKNGCSWSSSQMQKSFLNAIQLLVTLISTSSSSNLNLHSLTSLALGCSDSSFWPNTKWTLSGTRRVFMAFRSWMGFFGSQSVEPANQQGAKNLRQEILLFSTLLCCTLPRPNKKN